jgi:hypothetical protein
MTMNAGTEFALGTNHNLIVNGVIGNVGATIKSGAGELLNKLLGGGK